MHANRIAFCRKSLTRQRRKEFGRSLTGKRGHPPSRMNQAPAVNNYETSAIPISKICGAAYLIANSDCWSGPVRVGLICRIRPSGSGPAGSDLGGRLLRKGGCIGLTGAEPIAAHASASSHLIVGSFDNSPCFQRC